MSTTTDADAMALAATVTPDDLDGRSDAPTLAAADRTDAPALDAGEPDGPRYVTRRELGRGGMGEVRLDLDRRIGREVAVKRLRAEIADRGESRLRFLREARVQARLEHPSIVPVYDIDLNAADLSFTMRRVRGHTMRELIDRLREGDEATVERFGRRRLLSAFSQVCLAIDYAHSRGFLHRDLKPANVMLGDFGEVYVLDWGLARPLHERPEPVAADSGPVGDEPDVILHGSSSTRAGQILGTPGFMSPEQMTGQIDRLDARADVYALGATLFELLTHERLHDADTLAAIRGSTLMGVEERVHERCEAHEVPPELSELCRRAVATDPADRLPSARALSDAVERFLDGDRDAAMRKAQAEEHAESAARVAETAFESDDEAQRGAAAREAGRALALDPSHEGARRTLLSLLTTPPRRLPDAVRRSLAESRGQSMREFYVSTLGLLALYVPLVMVILLAADVREPITVALMVPSAGGTALAAWVGLRHPERASWIPLWILLGIGAAMVLFTRAVGPLVVVPLFAALNMLATSMFRSRSPRWLVVALGCLPVLVAAAGEALGLWSVTTAIVDGRIIVTPALLSIDYPQMLWILVLISALAPAASVLAMARISDRNAAAEEALHLQRWQLRQLLPEASS